MILIVLASSRSNDHISDANSDQSCSDRWVDCNHECDADANERDPNRDERLVIDVLTFVLHFQLHSFAQVSVTFMSVITEL